MASTNAQARIRYPEKRLQQASVAALAAQQGYRELFDDVEATGARVDSIGILNGQLWLIEYKVAVSGNMVRHVSDKGSSLESKVSGVLGPLYRRASDQVSTLCNGVWDRTRPPVFAVIAGSFTGAAISEFERLFYQRGSTWGFELQAIRWDGTKHDVVFAASPEVPFQPEQYELCAVEVLPVRQVRRKGLSMEEAVVRSDELGVGDLFRAFVGHARQRRLALKGQVHSVTAARTGQNAGTILGCYFRTSSSQTGLHVGLEEAAFSSDIVDVGVAAPVAGFLQTNRFLRSVEDVEHLFDKLEMADPGAL